MQYKPEGRFLEILEIMKPESRSAANLVWSYFWVTFESLFTTQGSDLKSTEKSLFSHFGVTLQKAPKGLKKLLFRYFDYFRKSAFCLVLHILILGDRVSNVFCFRTFFAFFGVQGALP